MRLKKRGRLIKTSDEIPCQKMLNIRLTPKMIASGVTHAYKILDTIDNTLVSQKIERLSKLVELANVSSIFGNIISSGIAIHLLVFTKKMPLTPTQIYLHVISVQKMLKSKFHLKATNQKVILQKKDITLHSDMF